MVGTTMSVKNFYKNSIKKKCRKLRKAKEITNLQFEIFADNRLLRTMIKKKKKVIIKLKIINDMKMKRKDQQCFCRLLD